jgi:hypothetical protein
MAKYLRQAELPVMPEGLQEALGVGSNFHFPLNGGARRHFRNLLASRSNTVRSSKVMWSILQGVKRGCAEVPGDFICKTMRDHQAALTQTLPWLGDDDMEEFRKKFRAIWRVEREVTSEGKRWAAFHPSRKMRHFADQPANPGFNACFENTRGKGGRAGFVRTRLLEELRHYDDIPEGISCEQWPLVRYTEDQPGRVVREGILPRVTPQYAVKLALDELRKNGGSCEATVAAILEPLKCRLITKGSGMPYFAAQPFQRAMWERLQKFQAFRLTGRPLMVSDLEDLVNRGKRLDLERFDKWVSGDYSAATDGLSQQINLACLEEAIQSASLSEDEAEVARAVLGNHDIHYVRGEGGDYRYDAEHESSYPNALKKHEHKIRQTNGQLMGCPLSFPILCVINVSAYWIALEKHTGRKFTIDELPVLVNGDDICFRADDEFYSVWKHWTKVAGFTLSAGKNYISPDFVTINSEGFVQRTDGHLEKVGFLNTGLLYSGRSVERRVDFQEEKKARVGLRPENREMPFAPKVNRVITESNDPRRTLLRVHELFREDIAFHTHRGEINMHATPELGGLGIVLPDDCTTRFTPWQQRVAGYLRSKWKDMSFGTILSSTEESEERVWDLNQPMGLDGRMTYCRKAKPSASVVLDVKPGRVVVRQKLEPLRENEQRWTLEPCSLMNYQAVRNDCNGEWKIRQLSAADKEAAREYQGSRVISPLEWHDELRVLKTVEADAEIDDTNVVDDDVTTAKSRLRRSDSRMVTTFRTDDGDLVEFSHAQSARR